MNGADLSIVEAGERARSFIRRGSDDRFDIRFLVVGISRLDIVRIRRSVLTNRVRVARAFRVSETDPLSADLNQHVFLPGFLLACITGGAHSPLVEFSVDC